MAQQPTGRPLTGRTVLGITAAGFAVVIGANMALVWAALGSFPGLEVRNSYVASQGFDRERAAQRALGWTARVSYRPGRVTLVVLDRDGARVLPAAITASVGRATHMAQDRALAFAPGAGGLVAPARLEPGPWQVRIAATAADGTGFRQRLDLRVPQ
ncbi:nitrogen fixation protein FixH [Rhodobacteraceae bacterium 2CG4]|uniref:Nitrogen fixation protein FixH n=1 Tax=Halovulum marinum TaxID=2662447 RepID=A0A6L5Z0W7_9RHOB|nr:FixH family protein [Halovulum marinum]MSU89604.1 nitrogen fixation protein FixH [Halovulum marinum]